MLIKYIYISYLVTSERSERGTKYDIVARAIKLILPSLEYDNLFIIYILVPLSRAKTRLYFQIIYTSSTFQNEFKMIV